MCLETLVDLDQLGLDDFPDEFWVVYLPASGRMGMAMLRVPDAIPGTYLAAFTAVDAAMAWADTIVNAPEQKMVAAVDLDTAREFALEKGAIGIAILDDPMRPRTHYVR